MKPTVTNLARHATRVAAVAALPGLMAAGCLFPGRDYNWRGDVAVLSPALTDHLGGLYDGCGRDWACTQRAFHEFMWVSPTSFARMPGERRQNFFAKGGPGDAFAQVSDHGQVWLAVPALNETTTDGGMCLGLPAVSSQQWTAQPC